MNRYLEAYKARQCTVDDVLAAIRDRDFVATSGGVNAPLLFYKNIHKIAPRLKQGIDFFTAQPIKRVTLSSWKARRAKEKSGRCQASCSARTSADTFRKAGWTMCPPIITARA